MKCTDNQPGKCPFLPRIDRGTPCIWNLARGLRSVGCNTSTRQSCLHTGTDCFRPPPHALQRPFEDLLAGGHGGPLTPDGDAIHAATAALRDLRHPSLEAESSPTGAKRPIQAGEGGGVRRKMTSEGAGPRTGYVSFQITRSLRIPRVIPWDNLVLMQVPDTPVLGKAQIWSAGGGGWGWKRCTHRSSERQAIRAPAVQVRGARTRTEDLYKANHLAHRPKTRPWIPLSTSSSSCSAALPASRCAAPRQTTGRLQRDRSPPPRARLGGWWRGGGEAAAVSWGATQPQHGSSSSSSERRVGAR